MPRSKGYKKQEALDGGYLNVRLSADLSAKLDRDCADYARRAGSRRLKGAGLLRPGAHLRRPPRCRRRRSGISLEGDEIGGVGARGGVYRSLASAHGQGPAGMERPADGGLLDARPGSGER
ncbi:MAG: hypothetical protein ACLSGS_00145 [Adlercreutzia sp.]